MSTAGPPQGARHRSAQRAGTPVGETATLQIELDGQPHALPAGQTLAELVAALGHAPQAVGTALNGEFVARSARATHRLRDGDAVVLFQPIVGG